MGLSSILLHHHVVSFLCSSLLDFQYLFSIVFLLYLHDDIVVSQVNACSNYMIGCCFVLKLFFKLMSLVLSQSFTHNQCRIFVYLLLSFFPLPSVFFPFYVTVDFSIEAAFNIAVVFPRLSFSRYYVVFIHVVINAFFCRFFSMMF